MSAASTPIPAGMRDAHEGERLIPYARSVWARREYIWYVAASEVRIGMSLAGGVSLKTGLPVRHQDDDAEEQDVDPAMEVVEYYRQVVATYTDDAEDGPAKALTKPPKK